MPTLSNVLNEALKKKGFGYVSIHHPRYIVNDDNPEVLILDKNYYKNKNGSAILAFNLHYLEELSDLSIKNVIRQIQRHDNSIVDIKGLKKFIKSVFNVGHYPSDTASKIKRYKQLVKRFPVLKKCIRHYKKRTMS